MELEIKKVDPSDVEVEAVVINDLDVEVCEVEL